MKYTLKIVADTNDADYVTAMHTISEAELKEIKPVIKAIKAFKPYKGKSDSGMSYTHDNNFPNGEYAYRPDLGGKSYQEIYKDVDQDALEYFAELAPHGEYGIYTIEAIEVTLEIKWTKLL